MELSAARRATRTSITNSSGQSTVPRNCRSASASSSIDRATRLEPSFRVWATDNLQPTSSLPPHVAAKTVETIDPSRISTFHRRLLTAYFSENRTISDWDVLRDLAADVGVDPDALTDEVEKHGDEIARRVIDDHNEAIAHGINAVPTTVIDDGMVVPGAQDVDTLEALVVRQIERRRAEPVG